VEVQALLGYFLPTSDKAVTLTRLANGNVMAIRGDGDHPRWVDEEETRNLSVCLVLSLLTETDRWPLRFDCGGSIYGNLYVMAATDLLGRLDPPRRQVCCFKSTRSARRRLRRPLPKELRRLVTLVSY
jgi:hypothetical protein